MTKQSKKSTLTKNRDDGSGRTALSEEQKPDSLLSPSTAAHQAREDAIESAPPREENLEISTPTGAQKSEKNPKNPQDPKKRSRGDTSTGFVLRTFIIKMGDSGHHYDPSNAWVDLHEQKHVLLLRDEYQAEQEQQRKNGRHGGLGAPENAWEEEDNP